MRVPPERPAPAAQPVIMEKSARTTFEVHVQGSTDPTLHTAETAFLSKAEADKYVAAKTAEEGDDEHEAPVRRVFQKIVETTLVLLG